jgi:hypothetical protein
MALLDNGQDLDVCAKEIGCAVGQLLTPLTRYRLRDPNRPWAIDNGAFAGFEERSFMALLDRTCERARPLETLRGNRCRYRRRYRHRALLAHAGADRQS